METALTASIHRKWQFQHTTKAVASRRRGYPHALTDQHDFTGLLKVKGYRKLLVVEDVAIIFGIGSNRKLSR